MFFFRTNDYFDCYPSFTLTTDQIDPEEKVVQTLHSFDTEKELLAIKWDKKTKLQSLVHIDKKDLTIKNKILSWFGAGKLAHTCYSLYDVCRYLSCYDFKSTKSQDNVHQKVYEKVCILAGKFLLKPKKSLYSYAASTYAKSPERLATLKLWIKNSEAKEASLYKAGSKKYVTYFNPAIEGDNPSLDPGQIHDIFRNLYIWSHQKDSG
ncbi:hypothetical protein [Parachlamydia sp. AcF125]|uniref:hypothetical protein n=1 Tax=Parachlamydia sp. AcF125 TaxID=2795736 RepID=UPI001BC9D3BC|nr:hypothetical protein [Parachlamydia sp. AcF125]MBS4168360.1 hypothetical protein [Parachlamydia sp. AcF125]